MKKSHENPYDEDVTYYTCPQCSVTVEHLYEGYCFYCWRLNQEKLDNHNIEYDLWNNYSNNKKIIL